jgi:hypothetical protein
VKLSVPRVNCSIQGDTQKIRATEVALFHFLQRVS